MSKMYLVVRRDTGWDWEREEFIAAYWYRDICEEACKLLNAAVKKTDDYRREYVVKSVLYPANKLMFDDIIKDCLEDEEE
jgi:hypothetical protein